MQIACLVLVSSCGSGGGGGNTGAAPPIVAAPVPLPAVSPFASTAATGDDWFTFAHDYQRTGFQPQQTGITAANVSSLKLRWKAVVAGEVYPSLLVYKGNVIVVTLLGNVYDLSSTDGHVIWQHTIGGEIRATPSIDNNVLYISNRLADSNRMPAPSWMFALRMSDGSTLWQEQVDGPTHGSPVVANGVVYVGTAGGDPETGCHDGGIIAFSAMTGALIWNWKVNPAVNGGGSSWGALAYDGSHIYLGTGNTCQNPWPRANGIVSLNLDGTLGWALSAVNDATLDQDDDTGSGVALWYGRATFMSKNGSLYTVNVADGQQLWRTPLGAADQQGGFASPTTNGSMIFVGSGLIATSSVQKSKGAPPVGTQWMNRRTTSAFPGYVSYVRAVDANGHIVWSRQMNNWIVNYVALTKGLAFAGLDTQMTALDPANGNVLWSYASPNIFEASPVIVPSGLYAADASGNVYAFALP